MRTLKALGYKVPTPIQVQAIPAVLAGRDLLAAAQTGTGKTAGFALPLLQRLASERTCRRQLRAILVLVPTRELAEQVMRASALRREPPVAHAVPPTAGSASIRR